MVDFPAAYEAHMALYKSDCCCCILF